MRAFQKLHIKIVLGLQAAGVNGGVGRLIENELGTTTMIITTTSTTEMGQNHLGIEDRGEEEGGGQGDCQMS